MTSALLLLGLGFTTGCLLGGKLKNLLNKLRNKSSPPTAPPPAV